MYFSHYYEITLCAARIYRETNIYIVKNRHINRKFKLSLRILYVIIIKEIPTPYIKAPTK